MGLQELFSSYIPYTIITGADDYNFVRYFETAV